MSNLTSNRKPQYKDVETAMVILDLSSQKVGDFEALKKANILKNTVSGLGDIGISTVTLKCTDWGLLVQVVDEIVDLLSTKVICRVPLQALPENPDVQWSAAVPIYLSVEISEVIQNDAQVTRYIDQLKHIQTKFTQGIDVVSVILPVIKENMDLASGFAQRIHNETNLSVVLNPELNITENVTPNGITWQELDLLYCKIIDIMRQEGINALLMELGMLPTRLLTEHPCNGYVCSGHTCHSDKSNLPRRLIVLPDGRVLPENSYVHNDLIIGNVRDAALPTIIRERYFNSESHQLFLATAKNVYVEWIQTCPFRVIPWGMLLADASNQNK